MIVELNGQIGCGKMTIGRVLADRLGARLLDNHTIYNPAFATTGFRTPDFYEMARAVRTLCFERVRKLGNEVPIVLTVAAGRDEDWGREWQQAIRALADARGDVLHGVHLQCALDEHRRRLTDPARAVMRKLTDLSLLGEQDRPVRLDHSDRMLTLDVTALTAAQAALRIAAWLNAA